MASPRIDIAGLNAVLKTALDAVVVMDTEGVVRGWNDVAESTFGLPADAAIGLRMSEAIIPERYREAHERGLQRFLATGEGPVIDNHIEIEAQAVDGREVPIELSITFTEHFGTPLFIGFLRDISERKRAERAQALLVQELNHRVKNLLGVVSGIAHLTLRNADSLDEFAGTFTGRLAALGRSHEILTSASWDRASLRALLTAMTEPYGRGERIALVGEDFDLAPRDFIAIGMILYELLTNAAKYGALAQPDGRLEIGWRREGDALELSWRESGATGVAPPTRSGFGTRMIEMSVRHDLAGSVEWKWDRGGLDFCMRFKPR